MIEQELPIVEGRDGEELTIIGVLAVDMEAGEGDLSIDEEFHQMSDILKLDLLKDWIGLLQLQYELAYRGLETDPAKLQPGPVTKTLN